MRFIRGMVFASPLAALAWRNSRIMGPFLACSGLPLLCRVTVEHMATGQCADSVVFPTWQSTLYEDLQARRVSWSKAKMIVAVCWVASSSSLQGTRLEELSVKWVSQLSDCWHFNVFIIISCYWNVVVRAQSKQVLADCSVFCGQW